MNIPIFHGSFETTIFSEWMDVTGMGLHMGLRNSLQWLLEKGANPNFAIGRTRKGPLYWALWRVPDEPGWKGMDALLLAYGADVNAKKDSEWTQLYTACYNMDFQVMKGLLLHGADPNIPTAEGDTPLIYLCDISWLSASTMNHFYKLELMSTS